MSDAGDATDTGRRRPILLRRPAVQAVQHGRYRVQRAPEAPPEALPEAPPEEPPEAPLPGTPSRTFRRQVNSANVNSALMPAKDGFRGGYEADFYAAAPRRGSGGGGLVVGFSGPAGVPLSVECKWIRPHLLGYHVSPGRLRTVQCKTEKTKADLLARYFSGSSKSELTGLNAIQIRSVHQGSPLPRCNIHNA